MNEYYSRIEPIASSQALKAIANAKKDNFIILDFDETLFLRNSTAEYIDSLRPRLLGFIVIFILKALRPWRWLPKPFSGKKTKDWYLVTVPSILLPWSWFLWQKQAKKLARKYSNEQIVRAVNTSNKTPVIVATLGFNFIVAPILEQMPIEHDRIVGCKFWDGASDRNLGKLAMVQRILSKSIIDQAILVTDSPDDLPLLEAVGYPCLCVWLGAKYEDPFRDFWLYRLYQKFKKLSRQNQNESIPQERSEWI